MTRADMVAEVVTEEWCGVLGLDAVPAGREEDFFAVGGNSLMAVTMIEKVERRLGIEFPIDAMFLEGTLSAVVAACLGRYEP